MQTALAPQGDGWQGSDSTEREMGPGLGGVRGQGVDNGHTLRGRSNWGQQSAAGERISRVASRAGAAGCVIDDTAAGSKATGPGARISALLVDAGLVAGTLCIYGALWSAVGRRSHVVGQTAAAGSAVHHPAL